VRPWRHAPTPREAFRAVAHLAHPFFRLAEGPADLGRWSYLAVDPVDVLAIEGTVRGPAADPWSALSSRWPEAVRRRGRPPPPFAGGWAVAMAYELRSAVESMPPPRAPAGGFPTLWLARYDAVAAWDRATGRALLCGTGRGVAAARAAGERLAAAIVARARDGSLERSREAGAPPPRARVVARTSPAGYRARVEAVRRRILRGDLFQANVSQRFDAPLRGTAAALFERLADATPAPFATYLGLPGGRAIASASPERFLALDARGRAETRPMKGTRPRGATPAEDRRERAALAASEKERAELAMIVDLSRHDLGRACEPGTVRVTTPRRLERYATVHQAVAVVRGRLARGATGVDLVRAAFPPGSVTGAPKVEAMRAIDALEREARGPYCGAIGWLDDGGAMDLAVAIRTLAVAGGRVTWRVGGGVTLASDPEAERRETLAKAAALRRAVLGAPS
jgi:para-aminobenzoate synthetase component 1